MNSTIDYTASMGTKLEFTPIATDYSAAVYTQIIGVKEIPAIGGTPSTIDTTTLDNMKFETIIYGLMPALQFEFPFNMEDPSAEANIAIAWGQHLDSVLRHWRITYSNGVTIEYDSKSIVSFDTLPTNEIAKFIMYHAPVQEPNITIPTTSG